MSLAVAESDALTPAQRSAISNIRQRAQDLRADAVITISHILNMSNVEPSTADAVRAAIRDHAHVVIHFHPDRPVGSRVVARALLEDGVYRNQFETGISNGLVSTALDGPRDSWEKSLFLAPTMTAQDYGRPRDPSMARWISPATQTARLLVSVPATWY